MSDDKDHGFSDAGHNSGENVSQADVDEQKGISGWQGAVADQTEAADAEDPDRPAVE